MLFESGWFGMATAGAKATLGGFVSIEAYGHTMALVRPAGAGSHAELAQNLEQWH